MNGFFSVSESPRRSLPILVPACGACGLLKKCQSPKMVTDGEGRKRILIVGESPGLDEDREGKPFIGKSGRFLRDKLSGLGIDLRKDCWITNAIICHPERNELPDKSIDHCRPNLLNTIKELKPEKIILLGGPAVKSLIGWLWKEDVGGIGRWVGWKIPCQRLNCWIAPTWHPAFILRSEGKAESQVAELLMERHLSEAIKLKGRPWDVVPDYKKQVQCIYSAENAANWIKTTFSRGVPVAWDIETHGLKPENDMEIYSCSLSDGMETISFPWQGEVIQAMKEWLQSDVPKIGFNCKFEDRWSRRILKVNVRNWIWDGMLAAHLLDNRPAVTGLKFNAFIHLGQESYNDTVAPFLKSSGGSNTRNRIKEADLGQVLVYGGLDALLEYKVAMIQAKQMGVKL